MDDIDEMGTMNEGERRSQQDFNYNARNAMSLKKSVVGNNEVNASKLIDTSSFRQPVAKVNPSQPRVPNPSAISYDREGA